MDKYYGNVNYDLVGLIPKSTKNILEVGCGVGATGAEIKKIMGCDINVVGIEYVENVGQQAKNNLDEVYIADAEKLDLPYGDNYFDCILYGDVLEHLVDPWALIKKHSKLLSRQGVMLACIPNIGYFKIIKMLEKGEWTYQKSGIMDKTHLRFFTRNTIHELFSGAGMSSEIVRCIEGGPRIKKLMNKFSIFSQPDKFVQQFIVQAVKE